MSERLRNIPIHGIATMLIETPNDNEMVIAREHYLKPIQINERTEPLEKLREVRENLHLLETLLKSTYPFADDVMCKVYYPEEYMDDSE